MQARGQEIQNEELQMPKQPLQVWDESRVMFRCCPDRKNPRCRRRMTRLWQQEQEQGHEQEQEQEQEQKREQEQEQPWLIRRRL